MRKRIVVGIAAAGLALSGGAVAIAQTDAPKAPTEQRSKPGQPGEKASPKHGRAHDKRGGPGFAIGHAVHGSLIVPVRPAEGVPADAATEFETVEFDRGKVVSATDDELTLERRDGETVTVQLNDDTKFRGASKGSELRKDSPVFVVSKDGVARHVGQPKSRGEGQSKRPSGDKSAPDKAPAPA